MRISNVAGVYVATQQVKGGGYVSVGSTLMQAVSRCLESVYKGERLVIDVRDL